MPEGRRPRGVTPCPKSGVAGSSQGAVAARAQEGLEELFHIQVKRGGGEEIYLVQGKRNPSKTVGVARGIRG